jgi:hypothetical protein
MRISRSLLGSAIAVGGIFIVFALQPAAGETGSTLRPTPAAESFTTLVQTNENEQEAVEPPSSWESVAPGIDYRKFQLADPNDVFVARFDRSNTDLSIESSIGQGRLTGGVETVSSMAASYEQTLSYWGQSWGSRNDVVIAINGSFFPASGIPNRGVIHSGWYSKRHDDFENGSGFFWKLDRQAYIGECVQHVAANQVIENLDSGFDIKIQGINVDRGSDELIVYTPQFDTSTETNASGTEILVAMQRPTLILPAPSMAVGTIVEIREGQGDTTLPFDHVVISGSGSQADKLDNSSNFDVGDQLGISQSVKHYEADCVTSQNSADWTKAFASVGGSFHFLKEGEIQSFTDPGANSPAPRTAVAFNDDYIYFIVVDGRNPGVSEGMTMAKLGSFAQNTLDAMEAIAQDGGGSSTMVVNGEVKNNTFCNTTFCSHRAFLPIVAGDGTGQARVLTVLDHQRAVSNGLMMVIIEPSVYSTLFSVSQNLTLSASADLRLGPGNNYGDIQSFSAGAAATVLDHSLNGVQATGESWWHVIINGNQGWMPEAALSASP